MKLKFTWRIWLWIIILILSIISVFITPTFLQKGVLITSVEQNSSAFEQGLRQGQIIQAIDGHSITSIKDFSEIVQGKYNSNQSVKTTITTRNAEYIVYSDSLDITVSELPKSNLKLGLDLKEEQEL